MIMFCVFSDSVFVYLATVKHSTKAQSCLPFAVIWSPRSEPLPCLTLTHQADVFLALNHPRASAHLYSQSLPTLLRLATPLLLLLPLLWKPHSRLWQGGFPLTPLLPCDRTRFLPVWPCVVWHAPSPQEL